MLSTEPRHRWSPVKRDLFDRFQTVSGVLAMTYKFVMPDLVPGIRARTKDQVRTRAPGTGAGRGNRSSEKIVLDQKPRAPSSLNPGRSRPESGALPARGCFFQ